MAATIPSEDALRTLTLKAVATPGVARSVFLSEEALRKLALKAPGVAGSVFLSEEALRKLALKAVATPAGAASVFLHLEPLLKLRRPLLVVCEVLRTTAGDRGDPPFRSPETLLAVRLERHVLFKGGFAFGVPALLLRSREAPSLLAPSLLGGVPALGRGIEALP